MMIKHRIWTLVSRKLSGEATASELGELARLIETQANTALYLQALEELWNVPVEKDEEFLEATYHLHLNRLKEKGFDLLTDKEDIHPLYFDVQTHAARQAKKDKLFFSLGMLFTIVLLIVMLYNFESPVKVLPAEKFTQSEISTKTGSRTKILLPDGSSVWLNGGSKLVYDNNSFNKKLREVTLTGEGYFDVIKNKERPFIIHAGKINIKVLGTVFNVKAYPGESSTETSLIRGSIEVTMENRRGKIMLQPNDKLIVSNELVTVEKVKANAGKAGSIVADSAVTLLTHLTRGNDENLIVETAWVENKLVFDKETFEVVAKKMERWYGVTVHIAGDKLKLQRLTGTFEKETLSEALMALQLSTPIFKYQIDHQTVNIFK